MLWRVKSGSTPTWSESDSGLELNIKIIMKKAENCWKNQNFLDIPPYWKASQTKCLL